MNISEMLARNRRMCPDHTALIELRPSTEVIDIADGRLGEIAVAVIDPRPRETLTEEEVNQFCEQSLPWHKRRLRIIFDRVPRNPTGKIEKPKLREKYAK